MKLLTYVIGALLAVALVLGVWWLCWSLWCWVLPQLWPTGPASLVAPGYWLFVGILFLLGIIGRTLRSGKD